MDIQNDRQTIRLIYGMLPLTCISISAFTAFPSAHFNLSLAFPKISNKVKTGHISLLKQTISIKLVHKRIYNFQGFQTSGTLEGPYYRGACLRGAY